MLLRDDKSFPYILITAGVSGRPRSASIAGRNRDGDYFGPFAAVNAVNRTITALERAFPDPLLLRHRVRKPHKAVPLVPDQALLGAVHRRDLEGRLCGAGAGGQDLPVGQEPGGEGKARQGDGPRRRSARFRARAAVARPLAALSAVQARQGINPRGVEEADVFAIHQGRRFQLHRGVLLPHRTELGQPRLFPPRRSHARAGGGAGRVPRAVLRR